VSFYDTVLRELIAALGAALFIGNLVALARRRADARRAGAAHARRASSDSPVRAEPGAPTTRGSELPEAPIARTLLYMLLGFVVMMWGIATLLVD
jgi:hypothetical protein